MTNTAIRRATGAVVAGLFVAVGGAVAIAPAHADPVYDQKFLDYLDAKGVPFESRTDIIRTAKQFCLDMGRQGGSTWKVGAGPGRGARSGSRSTSAPAPRSSRSAPPSAGPAPWPA